MQFSRRIWIARLLRKQQAGTGASRARTRIREWWQAEDGAEIAQVLLMIAVAVIFIVLIWQYGQTIWNFIASKIDQILGNG